MHVNVYIHNTQTRINVYTYIQTCTYRYIDYIEIYLEKEICIPLGAEYASSALRQLKALRSDWAVIQRIQDGAVDAVPYEPRSNLL